eukprot:9169960-Pyramimonas_sp.AAC.2
MAVPQPKAPLMIEDAAAAVPKPKALLMIEDAAVAVPEPKAPLMIQDAPVIEPKAEVGASDQSSVAPLTPPVKPPAVGSPSPPGGSPSPAIEDPYGGWMTNASGASSSTAASSVKKSLFHDKSSPTLSDMYSESSSSSESPAHRGPPIY